MENILLILLLIADITILTVALVFLSRARAIYNELLTFIKPESEGKPSPLALFIEGVSSAFARGVVAQAKATLMGIQSGQNRAEKAIEGDIAESAAGASPIISVLMNSFPALKRTLRRNPALVDLALSRLPSLTGHRVVSQPQSSLDNGSQPKFKLGG